MRALAGFAVVVSLSLSGCYKPNAPGGSYLCGVGNACPDGLSCKCGLCVASEDEAACSFEISAADGSRSMSIEEHQTFDVVVNALIKPGVPATKFNGEVTLSSTWGDVCVGTSGCVGLPDKVTLANGTATATIQLNRETIAPQSAILRAEFAGNVGTSGKLRINVDAPVFTADVAPVIAPLTGLPASSYGFASGFVAGPSVVKTTTSWLLYFIGAHVQKSGGKDQITTAVGLATSTDGKTFAAPTDPLFEAPIDDADTFGEASAFVAGDGAQVYFGRQQGYVDVGKTRKFGYATVAQLTSTSPTTGFALDMNPLVVLKGTGDSSCAYCTAIDTPTVIRDPNPALSGGGANASIMYFSTFQASADASSSPIAVVRASSADGKSFVVDPSPLIKSTTDEPVIFSPRVIVDGTTYKMFYSVTSAIVGGVVDPCVVHYHVGYATSSDGYFWVRSPRNVTRQTAPMTPVFDSPATGWEQKSSVLVGSVVPKDGIDPSSGLLLFYSAYKMQTQGCSANGVGRAARR